MFDIASLPTVPEATRWRTADMTPIERIQVEVDFSDLTTPAEELAAAGRAADQFAFVEQRVIAKRIGVINAEYLHGDEGIVESPLLPGQQGITTDEASFLGMHKAMQARLQRRIFDRKFSAHHAIGLFQP